MATTTCAVAALVLGLVSVSRLPLEYLPEITGRSLNISVSYTASAPQEVERVITRPLEEELASVGGLDSLESSSTASGAATTTSSPAFRPERISTRGPLRTPVTISR